MKSKISPHGRPTAYDRGQHMLICEALGVSRDPLAPGPTASEAVQTLLEQCRKGVQEDVKLTLLHLYLELENLAFHLSAAPDVACELHGLAERAKSLLPKDEHS